MAANRIGGIVGRLAALVVLAVLLASMGGSGAEARAECHGMAIGDHLMSDCQSMPVQAPTHAGCHCPAMAGFPVGGAVQLPAGPAPLALRLRVVPSHAGPLAHPIPPTHPPRA